jgi:hypothetical protein
MTNRYVEISTVVDAEFLCIVHPWPDQHDLIEPTGFATETRTQRCSVRSPHHPIDGGLPVNRVGVRSFDRL